jgi:HD-GYP domain-containing protein (c-di-GMP phosphodiesterase class II)
MAKYKIKHDDIIVGRPLSHSVYDEDDNLILKEGAVIKSGLQLNALLERSLYYYSLEPVKANNEEEPQITAKSYPFEIIDEVYSGLKILLGSSTIDLRLPTKIIKLCARLQDASEHDHDACLGMISLSQYYKYPIMHSIHTALVCKTILKRLGWQPEQRLIPMAAAMTMNISMIELQDRLHSQNKPLTEEQHAEILRHPERSVDMLKKCGVHDEVWLKTIIQHHELLDGSGYPYSRKEKDIAQPSRVITLGDIYGARVSGRAYRKPIPATAALRELLLGNGQCMDSTMSKILIKNLGLFPPGSFVELNNGEIAVVTRVGNDARHPIVCSVIRPDGRTYGKPVSRDSSVDTFRIKKILTKNEAGIEVNQYQLWGYI